MEPWYDRSDVRSDDDDDAKPAAKPSPLSKPPPQSPPLPDGHAQRNTTTNDDDNNRGSAPSPVVVPVAGDLPFLVTHWLAGLTAPLSSLSSSGLEAPLKNPSAAGSTDPTHKTDGVSVEERDQAMQTIRRATADLASAFAVMGAFGTKSTVHLSDDPDDATITETGTKAVTYADLKRTWTHTTPQHLETLVRSSVQASHWANHTIISTTTKATDGNNLLSNPRIETDSGEDVAVAPTPLPQNEVQASAERLAAARNNPRSGRSLQDAIVVGSETNDSSGATNNNNNGNHKNGNAVTTTPSKNGTSATVPTRQTDGYAETGPSALSTLHLPVRLPRTSPAVTPESAAAALRQSLDLSQQCTEQASQIRSLLRSLDRQRNLLQSLALGPSTAVASVTGIDQTQSTDDTRAAQLNSQRVIAQLERQLPSLRDTHGTTQRDAARARAVAVSEWQTLQTRARQSCLPRRQLVQHRRHALLENVMGAPPSKVGQARRDTRRSLLVSRFSHAATINTHLTYPVYCLKFDRTGRYFVTGADDYLVKVFCLSSTVAAVQNSRRRLVDTATRCTRGAVLVCTLKGHAGVINDIGVSADNSFLATASEDGDCRVWGLVDGCPVAILRGHVGGANMVSWSTLTPFRLVTTGADGLARTWDVREACLKRYGNLVGKRPEYSLKLNGQDVAEPNDMSSVDSTRAREDNVPVPPLPARDASEADSSAIDPPAIPPPPLPNAGLVSGVIPPPPLPQGNNANEDQAQNANANADEGPQIVAGRFVANGELDEGVKLISKLQHGATLDERVSGPGTRARRAAVKVICVARCPYGSHFATGSDDGIVRVWLDGDSKAVEKIDRTLTSSKAAQWEHTRQSHRCPISHLSAITDLHYSNKGDRILSASQKDGVVRIWSWSVDPSVSKPIGSDGRGRTNSCILLKLTNPNAVSPSSTRQGPRARSSRSQTATISCDVAVWIQDDTKVVTAQSELAKQSGNDIVPGSQFLFLWNSVDGHCLLGIAGAHSMQCPVILPHPYLPSVICSAGADGVMKLWDWETCECLFLHSNKAEFGPIEANERGKCFGYLDGEFSPDGTHLVLADDSGRITVFDSTVVRPEIAPFPEWMKEQYFSNDYYDLFYDSTGYCVERGSEQPPHLAPRGARCSHSGTPFSAKVNETFKGLHGPMPTCAAADRWHRQNTREKAACILTKQETSKGNQVRQYDSNITKLFQVGPRQTSQPSATTAENRPRTPPTGRSQAEGRLSNNWRWGDAYNDSIQEVADDEPDSDDEDFEVLDRANRAQIRNRQREGDASQPVVGELEDSESEDVELDEEEDFESPRVSRRSAASRQKEDDEDSDADLLEYASTNNTPSGPYVADYDIHPFKMASREKGNGICRLWTRRNESNSSYAGRKKYAPQVGDSVVYIPRAHFETILKFPSLEAPWQSWPEEAAWPVVRCSIRNIRYRFPFKDYKSLEGVVAKLTLEITGIPELASDRVLGWPAPTFTRPTRSHVFELSVFENGEADYITPIGLYESRLRQLESSIQASEEGTVEVEAFFASENTLEDAEFVSYAGRVVSSSDRNWDMADVNLSGSGYQSIGIVWEEDEGRGNDPDPVSPWEISLLSTNSQTPARPYLDEEEKKICRNALRTIKDLDGGSFFSLPVDPAYSDYLMRIEVPMDLRIISNRLEAGYYASRYSAVADVRLIYTNCAKYNGDDDELSALARAMYERFEELVLDAQEREVFHNFDTPMPGSNAAVLPNTEEEHVEPASSSAIQRRSLRQYHPPRSTLENLPQVPDSAPRRASSHGHRTRTATGSQRQRTSNRRSILEEVGHPETRQTLEQLSSIGDRSSRGRSTRSQARGSRSVPEPSTAQNQFGRTSRSARTSRAPAVPPSYAEVPSDADEETSPARGAPRRFSSGQIQRSRAERSARRARTSGNSIVETSVSRRPNEDPENGNSTQTNSRTRRSSRTPEDPLVTSAPLGVASVAHAAVLPGTKSSEDPCKTLPCRTTRASRKAPRVSPKSSVAQSDQDDIPGVMKTTRRPSRTEFSSGDESNESAFSEHTVDDSSEAECEESMDSESVENPHLTRATKVKFDHQLPDSEDSEPDVHAKTKDRKTTRSTRNSSVGSSPHGDSIVSSDDEIVRSRRRKTRSRTASHNDMSSSDEDVAPHKSGAKNRHHRTGQTTKDASTSRNARATRAYPDPASSDDEALTTRPSSTTSDRTRKRDASRTRALNSSKSYSELSSADENDAPKVSAAPVRKRQKTAASPQPKRPSKRKSMSRRRRKKRELIVAETMEKFDIAKWPEIAVPHISKVAKEILSRLRQMDEFEAFAIPVAESAEAIADTYLEHIDHPMDFRTIEEDRLNIYTSITGLQEDLVLVFGNCMLFNEEDTSFYATARAMLDALEEMYRDTCLTLRVRILHHRATP